MTAVAAPSQLLPCTIGVTTGPEAASTPYPKASLGANAFTRPDSGWYAHSLTPIWLCKVALHCKIQPRLTPFRRVASQPSSSRHFTEENNLLRPDQPVAS